VLNSATRSGDIVTVNTTLLVLNTIRFTNSINLDNGKCARLTMGNVQGSKGTNWYFVLLTT